MHTVPEARSQSHSPGVHSVIHWQNQSGNALECFVVPCFTAVANNGTSRGYDWRYVWYSCLIAPHQQRGMAQVKEDLATAEQQQQQQQEQVQAQQQERERQAEQAQHDRAQLDQQVHHVLLLQLVPVQGSLS